MAQIPLGLRTFVYSTYNTVFRLVFELSVQYLMLFSALAMFYDKVRQQKFEFNPLSSKQSYTFCTQEQFKNSPILS